MRQEQITITWYTPVENLPVLSDNNLSISESVFVRLRENASNYKQEFIAKMYYNYRSKQWLNCIDDSSLASPEYYNWEILEWCYLPFELR